MKNLADIQLGDRFTTSNDKGFVAVSTGNNPLLLNENGKTRILDGHRWYRENESDTYTEIEERFGALTHTPPTSKSAAALANWQSQRDAYKQHWESLSCQERAFCYVAPEKTVEVAGAAHAYKQAEADLAAAQEAVNAAARKRAEALASVVELVRTQRAAADILLLDQSRISRILKTLDASE